MRMLDLFSGLGGASAPFVWSEEWEVVRIDNHPALIYDAIIQGDLMSDTWHQLLPVWDFDLVWASPPCTNFSQANPNRKPHLGIPFVKRAKMIIDAVNPHVWIIENVKGSIKFLEPLLGPPRLILGPYVFWGNFPLFHADMKGYSKMENDAWSDDPLRPLKRAYIPPRVSRAFFNALKFQSKLPLDVLSSCVQDT